MMGGGEKRNALATKYLKAIIPYNCKIHASLYDARLPF